VAQALAARILDVKLIGAAWVLPAAIRRLIRSPRLTVVAPEHPSPSSFPIVPAILLLVAFALIVISKVFFAKQYGCDPCCDRVQSDPIVAPPQQIFPHASEVSDQMEDEARALVAAMEQRLQRLSSFAKQSFLSKTFKRLQIHTILSRSELVIKRRLESTIRARRHVKAKGQASGLKGVRRQLLYLDGLDNEPQSAAPTPAAGALSATSQQKIPSAGTPIGSTSPSPRSDRSRQGRSQPPSPQLSLNPSTPVVLPLPTQKPPPPPQRRELSPAWSRQLPLSATWSRQLPPQPLLHLPTQGPPEERLRAGLPSAEGMGRARSKLASARATRAEVAEAIISAAPELVTSAAPQATRAEMEAATTVRPKVARAVEAKANCQPAQADEDDAEIQATEKAEVVTEMQSEGTAEAKAQLAAEARAEELVRAVVRCHTSPLFRHTSPLASPVVATPTTSPTVARTVSPACAPASGAWERRSPSAVEDSSSLPRDTPRASEGAPCPTADDDSSEASNSPTRRNSRPSTDSMPSCDNRNVSNVSSNVSRDVSRDVGRSSSRSRSGSGPATPQRAPKRAKAAASAHRQSTPTPNTPRGSSLSSPKRRLSYVDRISLGKAEQQVSKGVVASGLRVQPARKARLGTASAGEQPTASAAEIIEKAAAWVRQAEVAGLRVQQSSAAPQMATAATEMPTVTAEGTESMCSESNAERRVRETHERATRGAGTNGTSTAAAPVRVSRTAERGNNRTTAWR